MQQKNYSVQQFTNLMNPEDGHKGMVAHIVDDEMVQVNLQGSIPVDQFAELVGKLGDILNHIVQETPTHEEVNSRISSVVESAREELKENNVVPFKANPHAQE